MYYPETHWGCGPVNCKVNIDHRTFECQGDTSSTRKSRIWARICSWLCLAERRLAHHMGIARKGHANFESDCPISRTKKHEEGWICIWGWNNLPSSHCRVNCVSEEAINEIMVYRHYCCIVSVTPCILTKSDSISRQFAAYDNESLQNNSRQMSVGRTNTWFQWVQILLPNPRIFRNTKPGGEIFWCANKAIYASHGAPLWARYTHIWLVPLSTWSVRVFV